jgi:hypothetical protein
LKAFAVIMIVLVLVAVAAIGFFCFSAKIDVRFVSCIATDGVTQVEFFDSMKKQVESGAFTGTSFSGATLGAADQYQFLTYTVRLENHAFLKAETIELRITPMEGDILQLGDENCYDLASGKQIEISATILASRSMHSVREGTVSYYLWGIPFTEKITLGK